MRLQQYINEIFKSTIDYDIETDNPNRLVYSFIEDNTPFTVMFWRDSLEDLLFLLESEDLIQRINKEFGKGIWDEKIYDFRFTSGRNKTFKSTGKFKAKSVKIFSYIIDIVKNAIKRRNMQYLYFVANKNERSRVKLYERMLNHLGKRYLRIDDEPDEVTFIVEI